MLHRIPLGFAVAALAVAACSARSSDAPSLDRTGGAQSPSAPSPQHAGVYCSRDGCWCASDAVPPDPIVNGVYNHPATSGIMPDLVPVHTCGVGDGTPCGNFARPGAYVSDDSPYFTRMVLTDLVCGFWSYCFFADRPDGTRVTGTYLFNSNGTVFDFDGTEVSIVNVMTELLADGGMVLYDYAYTTGATERVLFGTFHEVASSCDTDMDCTCGGTFTAGSATSCGAAATCVDHACRCPSADAGAPPPPPPATDAGASDATCDDASAPTPTPVPMDAAPPPPPPPPVVDAGEDCGP